MLARTPSAPLAAQKPLQGPTIAPGSPPRHEVAPRALTDRPRATLLTSDPQEQTALVPPSYDQKQPIDYFWEVSHVEHADGRITGSIWKMLPDCRAKRVGALRIAANGRLEVAPRSLRAVVAHYHGRNF